MFAPSDQGGTALGPHPAEQTMSKLRCQCGHVIVDQRADLPYLAGVLAEQDRDTVEDFADECVRYFAAVAAGRRQEWLARWYNKQNGALDGFADSSVVYDIFSSLVERHSRDLYQCQGCGRLHLQVAPQGDRFRSFAPDGEWHDALVGRARDSTK
jgi:hypothetical protein